MVINRSVYIGENNKFVIYLPQQNQILITSILSIQLNKYKSYSVHPSLTLSQCELLLQEVV